MKKKSLKKMNFLVVDDMDNMRRSIRAMLQIINYGKKIYEAPNGQVAWEILGKYGESIDFIISECAMPVMSGTELLHRIRLDKKLRNIPFLMITAEANMGVVAEAAERSGLQAVLDEKEIPVRPEVRAVCGVLGLDPLYLACEGRLVLWTAPEDADAALNVLKKHPAGEGSARIGVMRVRSHGASPVLLKARTGGERPIDVLSGAGLPRIC